MSPFIVFGAMFLLIFAFGTLALSNPEYNPDPHIRHDPTNLSDNITLGFASLIFTIPIFIIAIIFMRSRKMSLD